MNDEYVYKYPLVYSAGQKAAYFNFRVFWKWIVLSMWHGAVCFFGTIWVSILYFLLFRVWTGPSTGRAKLTHIGSNRVLLFR